MSQWTAQLPLLHDACLMAASFQIVVYLKSINVNI